MTAFKLEQFGGMLPAWDDHLIPNGQASSSVNAYLFSGALIGWRAPKLLHTLSNPSATYAYRIPKLTQGTASSTLSVNSNPNVGDNVKIGEDTYTFVDTLANAYDVLIGGDPTTSTANLYAAIVIGNGQGTLYANGTCKNPAISQVTGANTLSGRQITVVAPDFGFAYNTTPTLENTNGTRLSWTATTMLGGTNQTFDSAITSDSIWLEFLDHDTDVVKTPIADDKYRRYYFCSPSVQPQYNTYDRIAAGQPNWDLGVNAPGCAPGVSVTGGGNTVQLGFPTSNSANVVNSNNNAVYLVPITPNGAMELESISFMPFTTSTTAVMQGVVYEDNNNAPGQLLNVGAELIGLTAATEANSAFLNPSGLLQGGKYWIGVALSEDGSISQADDKPDNKTVYFAHTYTNGPPGFAPAVTTNIPDLQIWGNLLTSSVIEARVYLYTYVTEYDEEGPPSPPTLLNGWSNGSWTVSLFSPPADEMGVTRNVKTVRVYRTVTAVGGTTTYFWVCDYDLATNTISDVTTATGVLPGSVVVSGAAQITDTLGDDVVANNTQLASTNWFPPPEGLLGIRSMPNGIMVGFKGNELWFSEPYRPHAWPPGYVITTAFPIVGIGVVMNSVVACTSGMPYVATGVDPSTIALSTVELPEPCTSRGSILSGDTGVYYASPNGLILVTQAGQGSNVTQSWITRERWRQLTPPKTAHAILLASSYFCFGVVENGDNTYAQQGFTIELTQADNTSFTIWPQPGGHRVGFTQLTSPTSTDIYNVMVDPWTGTGLLVTNGGVYYYDFADTAPTIVPYKWRSKKYQQVSKKNFEAMKFFFSVPPGTPAQGTRNEAATADASWNTLAANQYGIVRVYADDKLVTTREIRSSGELLRILSGFKCETWQWEIEGRVLLSNMQAATSAKELGGV